MKNTSTTTLASLVSSLLNNSEEGITVKEALKHIEVQAKELNLTLSVNYRAVYQQMKSVGVRVCKGKFKSPSKEPEVNTLKTEDQVAA